MKKLTLSCLIISSFLILNSQTLFAQEQTDPLNLFIQKMLLMHQGKTLCPDPAISTNSIRSNIVNYLEDTYLKKNGTANANVIATAIWTLYPCPFSPNRSDLKLATFKDIEGVWLFPESSQKLRFGPKSNQKSPTGPIPVKCDAIGYFPNGELRSIIFAGKDECPFKKASDMDVARKNPQVSNWSLLRDGRVSVTRTDIENHIEEWDVYAVVTSFSANDVQFNKGDLLAYLRKENGNSVNASTQFRHWKRLP